MQPNPTLDQLQVFLAVTESGSFSGAPRALNRAQSVVSYAIANLEDQLGLALFDRTVTKRPQLTPAGKTVLEDARRLLGDLDLMRARVRSLNEGLEGELSVAISSIMPSGIVVEAAARLSQPFSDRIAERDGWHAGDCGRCGHFREGRDRLWRLAGG
ncbi:regulatory helix-turn-helix LysR family protein [Mesorhizobium tianshanense]|uniref:Regulatory helix-turn-helix LysR family protein n=1 Tax=Mesorhizobium tianshanense TaxID=39844 RepID=A0A562M7K6_9HYPH|nr:regulatory helix-turn-helix LysR family protein [Mesorhizobium tianshanense]